MCVYERAIRDYGYTSAYSIYIYMKQAIAVLGDLLAVIDDD